MLFKAYLSDSQTRHYHNDQSIKIEIMNTGLRTIPIPAAIQGASSVHLRATSNAVGMGKIIKNKQRSSKNPGNNNRIINAEIKKWTKANNIHLLIASLNWIESNRWESVEACIGVNIINMIKKRGRCDKWDDSVEWKRMLGWIGQGFLRLTTPERGEQWRRPIES